MIVVAEGAHPAEEPEEDLPVFADGSGAAYRVGQMIRKHLGMIPRVTVLGHVQRGGDPTARDRVNATRMGHHAVTILAEGLTNRIVVKTMTGVY